MTTAEPRLGRYSRALRRHVAEHPDDSEVQEVLEWIEEVQAVQLSQSARGETGFLDLLRASFEETLDQQGITTGRICEIGSAHNSFAAQLPAFDFTYLALGPSPKGADPDRSDVLVADVTQADHLPEEQFDAVFSVSVFEHVAKPWLAAAHLSRLLKPGGVMFHAAPFSYFYHRAPSDYWRFTPEAFAVLFSDLRTVKAEFFSGNRRRDNRGKPGNPVDQWGEQFAVDALGGWRENWMTVYAGVKDPDHLAALLETAKRQTVVNLMRQVVRSGVPADEAARIVRRRLRTVRVTRDQELWPCEPAESNFDFTAARIQRIWNRRRRPGGTPPSESQLLMARRLGLV